mmetsp:Transcript_37092/g.103211  ORF Transcript_37092/g.103211 Transcript_37092/m.103211 type:complete len:293 (+) Transcript_37092:670-1548(+)
MLLQPIWKEGGIWVDLHRPVVIPKLPSPEDGMPSLDEDLGVEPGAPLPLLRREVTDHGGQGAAAKVEGHVAVDRPLVAAEEAHPAAELKPQQGRLVARGPRECPTEERRVRPLHWGTRSKLLTGPRRLLRVIRMDAWCTYRHARRPAWVLLEALCAGTPAALRGNAIAAHVSALGGHPVLNLPAERRHARRPRPQRCAVPEAVIDVEEVRAVFAGDPAPSPARILLVAPHPRIAAALALQAAAARRRTLCCDPWRRFLGCPVASYGCTRCEAPQCNTIPGLGFEVRDVDHVR